MQMDLLADGEMPVPFSDAAWHAECLVNCSEEPEALAQLICQGAAAQAKEYAESAELCMGESHTKGVYTNVLIFSHSGTLVADVCYTTNCFESQRLVLGAISEGYQKVIWL